MDREQKKEFRGNIVKFLIGVVLLGLCRGYLLEHPAERVSVFSGFEVLWQKVEVFRHNMVGSNGELLENKYSMEKYYKELLTMAENNPCLTSDQYTELETTYKDLQKESNKDLENILPEYTRKAYMFESLVQNNDCDIEE